MKESLGKKLLVLILLSSSVVTLVTTSFQLYIDYKKDLTRLKESMQLIEKAHINTLTTSLWTFDKKQIRNILHGIQDSSDVQFVGIYGENDKEIYSVGNRSGSQVIEKSIPLIYQTNNTSHKVGNFQIHLSLRTVQQRLVDRILLVLLGQALKTFIVSFIILFLIRYFITRHLEKIATFLEGLDVRKGNIPLKLQRKPRNDEINIVVKNINSMISELKSVLVTLQVMNERLEQKVKERTSKLNSLLVKNENLLRVICHDVSNHITVVQSSLFLLGREKVKNDPAKFEEKLLKAQAHNETIIEILEHVKQLKSLESGKATLTLEKIDISEIITQLHDTFSEKIKEKNLKFDITGAEKPVFVMADKVSLRSNILNNLVSNAIKFTPPGEGVSIKIENKDGSVNIVIADKGIGIPDKLINKIFDPNEKTSRKGTKNEEGTGFGLPIVYMFVQYNKGKIVVESQTDGDNRGTRFKISLMAA